MMRSLVGLVLVLVMAPLASANPSGGATVRDFTILVEGEWAHGLLAIPRGPPIAAAVITHGYGHDAQSHRAHLAGLAERGLVAVAMDYRGDRDGFPLAAGAADTYAATAWILERFKPETVILFSVSMGAAVGAMAIADHPGVYDFWVASEPMANLIETWAEAKAVSPALAVGEAASRAIEDETGGTPLTAPDGYRERTAVLRVPEFKGLRGAFVVHGVWDGFVPYDQGRELTSVLRAHGIPTDMVNVVRGEGGGEGTTVSGYGGVQIDGLAGHGSESNDEHTLTRISWDVTYGFIEGGFGPTPADREIVSDRDLGGTLGL